MAPLHDMHCHLDFMSNGTDIARSALDAGTRLFANTVTPEGWESAKALFAPHSNVAVGFGLHPWWVRAAEDARQAIEALEEHDPHFIGEIGLDLGKRHSKTADAQITAFTLIAQWAASCGGKIVSIHSVHAAEPALDILQSTGAAESCTCIFHWFTGPSDQLKRAVQMGCYFSFGPRALSTGKGREYVKAVPTGQLLLETDYPPSQGATCPFEEYYGELRSAADSIAAIKSEQILETIAKTSEILLAR